MICGVIVLIKKLEINYKQNERKPGKSNETGNQVSAIGLDTFYNMCYFLRRIRLEKS